MPRDKRTQESSTGRVLIALFWFLYFGALGIFFPFYSLYLSENAGLTSSQVGLVLACIPLTGLVTQPQWGNLADRSGARRTVLCLLTLASAAGYTLLALPTTFMEFLVATAAMAVFATAVIPMSLSVALATLDRAGPHAFGLARVWGTIGYLISVIAFPRFLDWRQQRFGLHSSTEISEPGLEVMFVIIASGVAAAALSVTLLPDTGSIRAQAQGGDWRTLRHIRPAMALFLVTFLSFLFLQGPMALFPILVRSRGGDLQTVGQLWVVMLLLEIPLVALSGTWMKRLGARALLCVGITSGGARWLACGSDIGNELFYAVQILHGLTVTGLMVGAPLYLEEVVPENLRSTAQSLLAMLGIGAGGLLSNVATGWLVDHAGNHAPYFIGGVGALALGLSLPWILPEIRTGPMRQITARHP